MTTKPGDMLMYFANVTKYKDQSKMMIEKAYNASEKSLKNRTSPGNQKKSERGLEQYSLDTLCVTHF